MTDERFAFPPERLTANFPQPLSGHTDAAWPAPMDDFADR
jgi:hypothetical protein